MAALVKIDYEILSDIDLARHVSAHDSAAAQVVIQRNNQRLFRMARSILKNQSDAEDAVQSAYLNAFAAIGRFDGRSSLATWLTRIVINEALGRVRSAARRRERFDGASVVVIDEYRDKLMRGSMQASSADAAIARDQLRAVLEGAISELPDDFRLAFMMREIEGLSVEETADILGVPAATIKTRHLRARRRLQKSLDPELKSALQGTFPFGGSFCQALTDRVLHAFKSVTPKPKGNQSHD
jgi:RNA polymerase sigma-70 factor, ECF subfamily